MNHDVVQCQLALKAGKFYTSVTNMCVWGNHSTTQVPDFVNARIGGEVMFLLFNNSIKIKILIGVMGQKSVRVNFHVCMEQSDGTQSCGSLCCT